jgi:hypothetical protein
VDDIAAGVDQRFPQAEGVWPTETRMAMVGKRAADVGAGLMIVAGFTRLPLRHLGRTQQSAANHRAKAYDTDAHGGLSHSRNLNSIRFAVARPLGGIAAYWLRFNRCPRYVYLRVASGGVGLAQWPLCPQKQTCAAHKPMSLCAKSEHCAALCGPV